jgi:hypothetical protein
MCHFLFDIRRVKYRVPHVVGQEENDPEKEEDEALTTLPETGMMRHRRRGRGEKLRGFGCMAGLGAGDRWCWFLGFHEGVSLKTGKVGEG